MESHFYCIKNGKTLFNVRRFRDDQPLQPIGAGLTRNSSDLVPSCVAENEILDDQKGDSTLTRESYAAKITKFREERLDIRVIAYDHSFAGDRAWFLFAFKWTDERLARLIPKPSRPATSTITFPP